VKKLKYKAQMLIAPVGFFSFGKGKERLAFPEDVSRIGPFQKR
jgi:hypothetical protein